MNGPLMAPPARPTAACKRPAGEARRGRRGASPRAVQERQARGEARSNGGGRVASSHHDVLLQHLQPRRPIGLEQRVHHFVKLRLLLSRNTIPGGVREGTRSASHAAC